MKYQRFYTLLVALICSLGLGLSSLLADTSVGNAPKAHAAESLDGASGHGKGHDEGGDLGHGNAGAQLTDPSEWRSDMAIFNFIVFMCLIAVLGKFAWGPIMEGLKTREQTIADFHANAENDAAEAAKQLAEYKAQLAKAAEESRAIIEEARVNAQAEAQKILDDTDEKAKQKLDRALAEIDAAKNDALLEVAEKSADIAVSLAGRIVKREVNSQDHGQLISDALKQFPSKN
ncbi:MAG: F0F1 ATP synthase subunit B [Pirellulaceae bacterium]|nr:F0F1 ATP synthase subunit B [Pirellulaceae bacterium]